MTELETLERAKMYMEKLANGINPLDGTLIPDDEVVNDVRLSRCFFYVAGVLGQVIENGGTAPQKKHKKQPFALAMEKRESFAFSETPIPVSEITKRINDLVGEEAVSSLSYRSVRDWLTVTGFLEEVTDEEGKTSKRPTAEGEQLGIKQEARLGANGTYFVIVYDLSAQHFILDNLDAIIDFQNSKKENQGKPWTAEQDAHLTELYRKGVSVREMAAELKRNGSGIRARLKKLGLIQQ